MSDVQDLTAGVAVDLIRESDALFLDFDGTLAPIQDDADTVALPAGADGVIISLARKLEGALAILSGRGLGDLTKRVPPDVWRFGNHGLYAAAPGQAETPTPVPAPAGLLAGVEKAAMNYPGVRVEPKGPVIAIHYRAAPDAGGPLGKALAHAVEGFADYKLQHGKCVYEAKPIGANKGICLKAAMFDAPFAGRRPIMIGDDTTDEDAFLAARELGGLAIKVGPGDTAANYRLPDVDAVHLLLKEKI